MGPPTPLGMTPHDHFTLPWVGHRDEIPEEDFEKFMALGPALKEMFQRYQFAYHLSLILYRDSDHILVGFHIEDAVYAPLYYGYGGPGEYGDRASLARHTEAEILEKAPDTVLVLVKAGAEVIADRMRKDPHRRGVLKEKDIEFVLERFEYHYAHSLLRYKFTLDTSKATVAETTQQFVDDMEPHLGQADRMRIQTHRPPQAATQISGDIL